MRLGASIILLFILCGVAAAQVGISGIGGCPAGQVVTRLNSLAPPTCMTVSGGGGGSTLPAPPTPPQILFGQNGTAQWSAFVSGSDAVINNTGVVNLDLATQTCSTSCNVASSYVACNATSGPITLTLPAAVAGLPKFIKSLPSSTSTCTIAAQGGDLIDGSATLALPFAGNAVQLTGNGSGAWGISNLSYPVPQTLPAHNFATGITSGKLSSAQPSSTDLHDLPIPVSSGGTGGTSASKTTANNIGAAELGANSSITSMTGLTTPVPVNEGGTGSTAPTQGVGNGLSATGTFPNQTFTITSPVSVGNGGTGQQSAGAAAANAIGAAALGANNDITSLTGLTTPLAVSEGGTQCGSPTTIANLPASPTAGEICNVTNTSTCQTGVAVTPSTTGTLPCQVTWNGTNWLPAGGATTPGTAGFTNTGPGLTSAGQQVSLQVPVVATNGGTGSQTAPTSAQVPVGVGVGGSYAPQSITGDATLSSAGSLNVTKTGGTAFAASATTDTTNAGNINAGTLNPARLPNPGPSTLGGVESKAAVAHNFMTSITTLGVPTLAQPASTDLSDIPIPISSGGTGTTSPALVGGSGILTSGSWPNQTIALNPPVSVGNGGTGSTTAPSSAQILIGNSGGTAYAPQSITGDTTLSNAGATQVTATHLASALPVGQGGTGTTSAPSSAQLPLGNGGGTAYAPQTLSQDCTVSNTGVMTCTKTNNVAFTGLATASVPLTLPNGGTNCAGPTTVGGLATCNSASQGYICNVTDANGCTAGTSPTGGSSTKCQLVCNGTSWLPAGGASSAAAGGVTAVNATSPIASSGGTTPTISITNPLPVANGGTNAAAAGATAANNIGALAEANNLSDVANATTARGNLTAAKSGANSDITSLTGLTTPLSTGQGGSGVASPTAHSLLMGEGASAFSLLTAVTAGDLVLDQGAGADFQLKAMSGDCVITSAGAITCTKTGGTALTSIATATPPLSISLGGTQCGVPTTVASLPGSPTQGEICNVTDAASCSIGTSPAGGGSTKCQLTWSGTSWLPAGYAVAGGVTSVGASSPLSSTGGNSPVISITSPLPVANGGTNATAAGATAANNIGALAEANNLSDVANVATARGNLVAAKSGANSDITSLTGLTTPLSVAQGGSGTATPSIQPGNNISVTGSWPNQTITGTSTQVPINQLPNQTAKYLANSQGIGGVACPTLANDVLVQACAASVTTLIATTSVTAPFHQSSAANPAASGLLRDVNASTSVAARNAANSLDIPEIGTDASNVVHVGGTNAASISLDNALTAPLAAGSGGSGVANPTAHDIPITEGASAFNLVSLINDQLLLGATGANPAPVSLVNCGDSSHGLAYSTSTHTFSCQSITGSAGTTAGFINTPAVTAGNPATATLVAQCTSPGCTDNEIVANGANANGLQLTTPAAASMNNGEYLYVRVGDNGTAPSSITWAAGVGVTLDFANLGNASTTGANAACGAPPATGSLVYWYYWNSTASTLTLLYCSPDPARTSLPVGLGGTNGTTSSATTANNIGAAAKGANSDITSITGLTTPLSATEGGSGVASPTANGILYGNGASAFGNVVLANDQLLIGNTSAAPTAASGSLLCGDSTHALAYSHAAGFFCQAITATATPGGTTGAMQWNNAGTMAGLNGSGIPVLNGASAPTILAGNTLTAHNFANQISASGVLAGAQPAFTDISGALAAGQLPSGWNPVTPANGGTGCTSIPTAGQLLMGNLTGSYCPETMSGDATITSTGVVTNTKVNGGAIPLNAVALASNGTNQIIAATVQGAGDTKVQLASGTTVSGHCVQYDANGGIVDSGSACAGGGAFALSIAAAQSSALYGGAL